MDLLHGEAGRILSFVTYLIVFLAVGWWINRGKRKKR